MVASLAATGCSASPTNPEPGECDENEDEDCDADPSKGDDDDDTTGDDDEDDDTTADDDVEDDDVEPAPAKDAGKPDAAPPSGGGRIDGGLPGFPRTDGSFTFPRPDAGGTTPPDTTLPPTSGGAEPILPAESGACPEFKNGTVMVAGHRGVQLVVGSPDKKGALLFVWHGTGGNAAQGLRQIPASVQSEVTGSGGIIASFNGSMSSKAEGDCSGTGAHNIADFKAADQIAACAVKMHGIDPKRIYTTGCSAGGLQSGCMAQARANYIAAAAPNSGGVVAPRQWQGMGKPAIFTMHGGASDMVIVSFDQTSRTLDMSAKTRGSFVVNCNHGGGHCLAPQALQVAAWKFMKDHPYGAESPWKAGIPAGVPEYCKIF
jgi:predicted esterase